jgi:hypothetical protein
MKCFAGTTSAFEFAHIITRNPANINPFFPQWKHICLNVLKSYKNLRQKSFKTLRRFTPGVLIIINFIVTDVPDNKC